jgi:hypothetical protein
MKNILSLAGIFTSLAFALLSAPFAIPSATAAMSPVAVSIVPPIEFPGRDFDIIGLRLSALWGNQRNVSGLDFGIIGNMTDGDEAGISASGVFNYNKGQTTGVLLQAAGIGNFNVGKTRIYGIQLAGIVNSNRSESTVGGLQVALFNIGPYTNIRGFQVGVYNRAHDVAGFQIGLVNETDFLHGIQIGLVNIYHQGLFSVAPILNVGF